MGVSVFSYLSDLFVLSDAEAMLRVQKNGDCRAFTLLMNRWQGRIHRLCLRLTGDEHLAEDLTQEVFMRLYSRRTNYRHEGAFGIYLRRIAVNACCDHGRRLKCRPVCSLNGNDNRDGAGHVAADSGCSPQASAIKNESAEMVRGALMDLPEHYRQVLVLRHYEGLRFREIAQVLAVPQGTVQSRMAEALKKLGHSLKPVMKPEESKEK